MTDDPRHFALQAALRRMRVHLELAVADNDAAIAAWDAIDDQRIDESTSGTATASGTLPRDIAPLSATPPSTGALAVAEAAMPAIRVSDFGRMDMTIETLAMSIDKMIAKRTDDRRVTRASTLKTGVEVLFTPLRITVDTGGEEWADYTAFYLNSDGRIDDEVEVTHFEDTEHQFQNAETGERRSGSPIIPRRWPDDEASHA